MFCSNCACELPAIAKFCVKCGSRIDSSTGTSAVGNVTVPRIAQSTGEASVESKKAEFLDSKSPPPFPYADGNRLVVPRNSVLPGLCVQCGNSPTEPWLRKTFSWHNPLLYVLLFSPIIYVIVALIVQQRLKLSVPLCVAHKSIRKKRLWLAAILLLGCIPIPVALRGLYRERCRWTRGLRAWVGDVCSRIGILWVCISPFIPNTSVPLRRNSRVLANNFCSTFLSGQPPAADPIAPQLCRGLGWAIL